VRLAVVLNTYNYRGGCHQRALGDWLMVLLVVLCCQLAMLKFMADRGLFVAMVGIPLAKCNGNNILLVALVLVLLLLSNCALKVLSTRGPWQ
jgi:hypothetical protein